MSDERLRELERANAQGDPFARVVLLEELRRLGRPLIDPRTGIELVYVPEVQIECEKCGGLIKKQFDCGACGATGRRKIAPFYLGRFPVTNEQWERFWIGRPTNEPERGYTLETRRDRLHHPVVNVSHADALAFCGWAGLRLPSAREWLLAARGGEAQKKTDGGARCPQCRAEFARWPEGTPERVLLTHAGWCARHGPQTGLVFFTQEVRYAWGDETPTPERCWWEGAGLPRGTAVRQRDGVLVPLADAATMAFLRGAGELPSDVRVLADATRPTGTAPVLDPATFDRATGEPVTFKPARLAGASWCGALDMFGNVWEFTSNRDHRGEPVSLGGSWRTTTEALHMPLGRAAPSRGTAQDDVGFRVALSASP